MSEVLLEDLLSDPLASLSRLGEGLTKEERRKRLTDRLNAVQQETDATKRRLNGAKQKIEVARSKYEDMNDLLRTMEQLKCSLEEHIRTVRLNEGSFAGTSAVLEYDNAKQRTHTLITVINALSQLNHAKEIVADGCEDQQKLYDSLVEMQSSYDTLNKFVSGTFDSKCLEDLKDRHLSWQSTAMVFAIQQSDYGKLMEIQKTYSSLGRENEFVSIFRKMSMNRMKDIELSSTSLQSLVDGLHREIQFIYGHHYKLLRRFQSEEESVSLLTEAIREGLNSIDMTSSISGIIGNEPNPIELLQKVNKTLNSPNADSETCSQSLTELLNERLKEELIVPFRGALTTYILSRVNTLELTTGSFRSRVESLKTSIAELIQMMHDVVADCALVFGTSVNKVAQQPLDRGLENFLVKLRAWEYSLDSQRKRRSLEDLMTVCGAAGQFVYGLQQLKEMLEDIDPSLAPNTKSALKWNRTVVETVLKSSSETITEKMVVKMKEIKSSTAQDSAAHLPSFSTSPHEYVTTAGQELLQLFHRWEQFFLDDNVAHAFYMAFKKKYEGDELFKKTVADVANGIISQFVSAAGEPTSLSVDTAKQFLADTCFLKDAFDDLRTGNTEQLTMLENKLKSKIKP